MHLMCGFWLIHSFLDEPSGHVQVGQPRLLTRQEYADGWGPTAGDRIQLGDTNLIARVEHDYNVYGDELLFGGGKTFREGQGQVCDPIAL